MFSPQTHQNVPSKMERKLTEKNLISKWWKCPCALYFFFFLIWSMDSIRCLLLFFFLLISWLHPVALLFLFFFFFFCFLLWFFFRCGFFSRYNFYFLINLGDFFFFLSLFCFNRASFFNKAIWVNLYKHIFFIPPFFHSQPNKNKEN